MDKIYLTWGDVDYFIDKNLDLLVAERYDFVVGLSRGGLIPAVILSHLLEVPLRVIEYSSKKGNGDKVNSNTIPNWFFGYDKILIVDDIADSGNTLKELSYGPKNAHTFVLTYKEQSCYTPTFIGTTVPNESWIVFPWET